MSWRLHIWGGHFRNEVLLKKFVLPVGGSMRFLTPRFVAALLFFSALIPLKAQAALILDQSYALTDPSLYNLSAGYGSINPQQERAQTFTVGVKGLLTRVDVYIRRFSGTVGSLVSDIRAVDLLGHPTTALASITTVGTDIFTFPHPVDFFTLDFSKNPVSVVAGEQLAIVMHATTGDMTFQWIGSTTTSYTRGAMQEQVIGNHTWGFDFPNGDYGFYTYVNVPEPATVAAPLITLLLCRRRSRSKQLVLSS